MSRRRASLAAAGLTSVVLAAATSALAAGHSSPKLKTHRVNVTTIFSAITLSGPFGAPGTTEKDAGIQTGTIDGKSIGTGALEDTATWAAGFVLHGKGIAFDTHGTVNVTDTVKATAQHNGTFTLRGTITFHGGTGPYKRITGTIPVTGTAPIAGDPNQFTGTFHAKGTVKY